MQICFSKDAGRRFVREACLRQPFFFLLVLAEQQNERRIGSMNIYDGIEQERQQALDAVNTNEAAFEAAQQRADAAHNPIVRRVLGYVANVKARDAFDSAEHFDMIDQLAALEAQDATN